MLQSSQSILRIVWPDTHVEGGLDFLEIGYGFRRQIGEHLVKKGFQGLEKDGSFEYLEQISAHMQGHQFGVGKRERKVEPVGFDEFPALAAISFLGIDGEPGQLKVVKIPVGSPQ